MQSGQELRWRRTDESDWLAHCSKHEYLRLFYGRIYTARQDYRYSETNDLIWNLKIGPNEQHRLRYKQCAIAQFAQEVIDLFRWSVPPQISLVLVPIPPSKTQGHSKYDDRIKVVANKVMESCQNVRSLPILSTTQDRPASHLNMGSRDANEIYNSITVDKNLISCYQQGDILVVLDDVLTSGASFSAARRHLQETFPDATIDGLFWAKAQQLGC